MAREAAIMKGVYHPFPLLLAALFIVFPISLATRFYVVITSSTIKCHFFILFFFPFRWAKHLKREPELPPNKQLKSLRRTKGKEDDEGTGGRSVE